jgi:hypothetical protein
MKSNLAPAFEYLDSLVAKGSRRRSPPKLLIVKLLCVVARTLKR